MTDMIVSDAGSWGVDGTYVETGTRNSKPYYMKGDWELDWTGSMWDLANDSGSHVTYYYSNDDVATPNLCTTWGKYKVAELPLPPVLTLKEKVDVLVDGHPGLFK